MEDVRLKLFMKLFETGSFTLSAKAFGLSQSAASQSIAALEKNLGVKLFVRKRGKALPTVEGTIFKQYAEQILYWQSSVEAMFGSRGKISMQRPVRIASDEALAAYLLPGALAALHKAQPKLSFNVQPVGWGDSDGCDVELTLSPTPKSLDFLGEGMLLGYMEAAVVVSTLNDALAPSASTEGGAIPYFSTLAGIHVSERFAVWSSYTPLLGPGLTARTITESSSIEAIKRMVAVSDDVVGIVPLLSVREELASHSLLRLPIPLPDFTFDIHFRPSSGFAPRTACVLLRRALADRLRF